jgi:hypothetical protein
MRIDTTLRRGVTLALLLALLGSAAAGVSGGGKSRGKSKGEPTSKGKSKSEGSSKKANERPPPSADPDDSRSYYDVLGLRKDCSETEVKPPNHEPQTLDAKSWTLHPRPRTLHTKP